MGEKPIIEDCAQAFMSEYKGKPVGLRAEAGVFSTGYGKLFGIGTGGFVVTSNDTFGAGLKQQAEQLQYPSRATVVSGALRCLGLGIMYSPLIYSMFTYPVKNKLLKGNVALQEYPFRETTLTSAGISRIARNFTMNQRKVQLQRTNGLLLHELVDKRFIPVEPLNGSEPNYFVFPLQSEERDRVVTYLAARGIEAGKFFSNSFYWVQAFGYIKGDCPGFERIASTLFTLPCHDYLSVTQVKYIAETLNRYYVD